MFDTIQRPYKECSAPETIALVKSILTPLGLLPAESFRASPYPGLHSVCLELPAARGGFRANGKGRTTEYCLASAYAEFLERIQNGLYAVFPRTIVSSFKQRHGFYYAPDEHYLTEREFSTLPLEVTNDIIRYNGAGRNEFMSSYYQRVLDNGAPGVVGVPFFDTMKQEVISLPFNLLLLTVGSNGMAAGNTQAEALYQALCELLERWGAAEVFYRRLTPPTVPRDFVAGFIGEMAIIRAIESSGKYRITIKDFSAGRRIPSLGILVEIPGLNKYRLNVGCDTCFQVALSRCLTEIYQGVSNETMFDEAALTIPDEEAPYFISSEGISMYQRYAEFSQFTVDNRGQFPLSLFADKPSYQFDPLTWTQSSSHTSEVRRLISFFHEQGYNVYLRDVSFLGFPSVFCYIPEVSALGRKNVPPLSLSQTPIMLQLDRIESQAFRLKVCSEKELDEIASILEKINESMSFTDVFGIKLKPESPWSELNLAFLLSQIWYRLGRFDKARDSFSLFLKDREEDKNPYYEVVGHYLEMRAGGLSKEEAASRLAEDREKAEIARIVAADMARPEEIFRFDKLPSCPDCPRCELRPDCATAGKIATMEILFTAMASRQIQQTDLSWVNSTGTIESNSR
ncbi:MAG: YcaO-like family protein [Dehalococcoidales bacterium]|nr:YcaO-like family protein [Dehalococcoidales bacterium]